MAIIPFYFIDILIQQYRCSRDERIHVCFFFSSRRRHTRCSRDWSSDVCSSDLGYWPAKKGRDALEITWDEGPNAGVSSASISQLFAQRAEQPGAVARHDGAPDAALPAAPTKLDAAYELPFLAHATMEPMNCTAHVRADGVDIWDPTQFQTGAQGLGAGIGGV